MSLDFRQFGNVGARPTGGETINSNTATGEFAYTYDALLTAVSYSNFMNRSSSPTTENSTAHVVRGAVDLNRDRFGVDGSYAPTRATFDVSSPYWSHSVDGHGYWVFTPTTRGTLSAVFTDHLADQSGQDFQLTGGRLGAVVSVGPGGSLSAEAGPDVYIPEGHGPRVYPAGKLTYTQRFPVLAMALSYEEGIRDQFQAVGINALTRSRSASLLLTGLMFRDLIPSLAVRFNWQKIQQASLTSEPLGQADQTVDIEARMQYFFLRPLSATLSYILTLRNSNAPTAGFVENRVQFGLTYYHNLFF
jgi:hypothetical protein